MTNEEVSEKVRQAQNENYSIHRMATGCDFWLQVRNKRFLRTKVQEKELSCAELMMKAQVTIELEIELQRETDFPLA